jgi:hypothetical protein
MKVDEIIHGFSNIAFVVGEQWMRKNHAWIDEHLTQRLLWYDQLEKDLILISQKIDRQTLVSPYRSGLRDPNSFQKTLLEVHGAAVLAAPAISIQLHVPRGDDSGRNFDILATIDDLAVNAECKTRKDDFPFNLPRQEGGATGITGFFGRRATVDPHDAERLGLPSTRAPDDVHSRDTPESTTIRQIIGEARSQLPVSGINLILFGHIEGDRKQLERALFGAELLTFYKDTQRKKIVCTEWSLTPTGAFDAGQPGEPFRSISGVLWFRLFKVGTVFGRTYTLYLNPNATSRLPEIIVSRLEETINEWTTWPD